MSSNGRLCTTCRVVREPESFTSDRPRAKCQPCRLALSASRPPGALRAMSLWSNYRITQADYDALRAEQDNRCAICGDHEDDITYSRGGRPRTDGSPPADTFKLVVDHCHRTGRIRGLLCNGCNFLVGRAGERESALLAAVEYLKRQPTFVPSAPPLLDFEGNPAA